MRWSLILPNLITILSIHSFFSLAVVTPSNLVELENRGWGKASSQTYRKNTVNAPHSYTVGRNSVTRTDLKPEDRQAYGQRHISNSNMHADHIYEAQMVKSHLQKNGVQNFADLPTHLQKKVKGIVNGPGNMAFIYGSINMAKGQAVRKGLAGKNAKSAPKIDNLRASYMKESYPSAINTAKKLDHAFKTSKDPKYKKMVGFEDTLHHTMGVLKVPKPGDPSPPPRRSPRLQAKLKQAVNNLPAAKKSRVQKSRDAKQVRKSARLQRKAAGT